MNTRNQRRVAWSVLTLLYAGAWGALLWLVAVLAAGCSKTVYVPAETTRTEHERTAMWRTDTVIERDTVSVLQRGDSIISETVKWRWRTKETRDTVVVGRTDSVAVPYPVERGLTRWERTKMDYGGLALSAMAVALCMAVAWLAVKFRR